MATDLGLVPHAAQGDPDELAVHGTGDGLAERGLAHAGRADEGEDGPCAPALDAPEAALATELAHGQVLEDPVLHVSEPVVVLVEDPGRFGHVQTVLRLDAPGQLGDRVQPGAGPSVLRALLARPLELVDLALYGGAHALGQVTLGEAGAVVVGCGLAARAELAELLADRLELPAQQELALGLLHPLLDVGLDPLAQGQVGQHLPGPAGDHAQTFGHVGRLEHLDLLLEGEVRRVARDVGQTPGLCDLREALGQAAGAAAVQDVLEHRPVLTGQLALLGRGRAVRRLLDLDPQGPARPGDGDPEAGTLDAPQDGCRETARKLATLGDLGDHADGG
ncbi:MAG TPA: hypothetical protein VKW77_08960, partial [Acidimicrobiales bacterium]|nr:hypothetical protein [Acidimicrobiales bacterium]